MIDRIMTLVRRELAAYFNSAIAYIVVIFYLGFTAVWLFYIQQFLVQNMASLRAYFAIVPSLFIILMPAITMRSWAEEKKLGTAELLLTLPYREIELVMGKYFGALTLVALMLILSLPVPLMVSPLGDFESGQIIGQYLGVFLLASAAIAVGQFISSLSRNQVSAFILGAVFMLFLSLISQINFLLVPPRPIASFINWLSLSYHFRGFEIGLVDTRDVLYYVGLTVLFLYLSVKTLILRKWSH